MGQAQGVPEEIKAKSFTVIDDTGSVRAVLEMGPVGPTLAMYDDDSPSVALGTIAGHAMLTLGDKNGIGRIALGIVGPDAGLLLLDDEGLFSVSLFARESGPTLKLTNEQGETIWKVPE